MQDEQASKATSRRWTRFLGIGAGVIAIAAALLFFSLPELKRAMYEPGGRDGWQQPVRVVDTLALAQGQRIADLGSGGGYFSFRFAGRIGERGVVYATDVDADMNELVMNDATERGLRNVATVLAALDDPRLPEPVDWFFTSNTYHHLDDRVAYFARVREKYLLPGGRVAIIDFKPEITKHSTDRGVIVEEMTAAGFELTGDHDWLERQWFGVFTPNPAER